MYAEHTQIDSERWDGCNSIERINIYILIYLQSEYIEKYQVELCSKCDREYNFDMSQACQ